MALDAALAAGDPDRRADCPRRGPRHIGRHDSLPELQGQGGGGLHRARGDDRELVASVPANHVTVAVDSLPQQSRHRGDHPVADDVTIELVHHPEVIEINEQHGDLAPLLQEIRGLLTQGPGPRQIGHRIGQPAEFFEEISTGDDSDKDAVVHHGQPSDPPAVHQRIRIGDALRRRHGQHIPDHHLAHRPVRRLAHQIFERDHPDNGPTL